MKHWRGFVRTVAWIVFMIYLVGLVYFLFFSETLGRVPGVVYRYNLVPFQEIRRCIRYWDRIGSYYAFLNLFGNVLCFIPFGAVLPIISARQRRFWRVAALSLLSSSLVELIQLVSKVGSCDVDDVLLNTLGGACGYLIFKLCYYIFCRLRAARNARRSDQSKSVGQEKRFESDHQERIEKRSTGFEAEDLQLHQKRTGERVI